MDTIGGLLGVLMVMAVYLVPTWVAAVRRHHQTLAISVLNVLLGWTVIGWIAALVWGLTAVRSGLPVVSAAAPGWYPDPDPAVAAAGGLRWWDGHGWTGTSGADPA
jgi:hypothetical protein